MQIMLGANVSFKIFFVNDPIFVSIYRGASFKSWLFFQQEKKTFSFDNSEQAVHLEIDIEIVNSIGEYWTTFQKIISNYNPIRKQNEHNCSSSLCPYTQKKQTQKKIDVFLLKRIKSY